MLALIVFLISAISTSLVITLVNNYIIADIRFNLKILVLVILPLLGMVGVLL